MKVDVCCCCFALGVVLTLLYPFPFDRYSLVASSGTQEDEGEDASSHDEDGKEERKSESRKSLLKKHSSLARDTEIMKKDLELVRKHSTGDSLSTGLPAPPPPPPLDTDRLRSATNSDGLLAVLGTAQVLKAMQDSSAKKPREIEGKPMVLAGLDHP